MRNYRVQKEKDSTRIQDTKKCIFYETGCSGVNDCDGYGNPIKHRDGEKCTRKIIDEETLWR